MVDRDIEERTFNTISSTYCMAILRQGKVRFYLKQMKDKDRWQLTSDYTKAYRFSFSTYAEEAIKDYCKMYGAPDYQFGVLKVTEELQVVRRVPHQ